MAIVLDAVQTTGGNWFAKKVDSLGREYYHKEGEGRVAQTSWAAAKSHSVEAERLSRGNLGDISDVTDLGFPFDQTLTVPTRSLPRGSIQRFKGAEVNRWLGFRYADGTPDDPVEAAKEYMAFKQEIKDAPPDEVPDIKERYNIGGSE